MTAAVTCRPGRAYWQFVGLMIFFSGMSFLVAFLPPSRPQEIAAFGTMAGLCAAGALLTALWVMRAQIVADDSSLRWRSLGKWRTAQWEDVSDFYDKLPPPDKRIAKTATVIVTQNGTVKIGQDWDERERLREIVAQNAVNSQASEWGILGTRPEDNWPRIFRYDALSSQPLPISIFFVGLVSLFAFAVGPKLVHTYGTPEWIWNVAGGVVTLMLLLPFGGVLIWTIGIQRRRFRQKIIVTRAGICFEDGAQTIEANWPDVTNFYEEMDARSTRYILETRHGNFDFTAALTDARLLMLIVAQNAPGEWKRRGDFDTLGGVTAQWSSGREGVGERIYHYRTRSNRALLWLIGLFAFLLPLGIGLQIALGIPVKGDLHIPFGISSILLAAFLWTIWRYYAAAIHTNGDGITQYAPFGKRHLRWAEITEYARKSSDDPRFVLRNDKGQQIVFWSGIVGEGELKDEIERRAANSRNQTWNSVSQSNSVRTQQHGR